jgi:beta-ribofuranosylaminobenzene 5'-phosphate synthase
MNALIPVERSVSVTTYGRLHLGFFNLSADATRQFGSMGVAIDAFQTALTVSIGEQSQPLDGWAATIVQRHLAAIGVQQAVNLSIQQAIPRHGGLGSGTQMALAIGVALNQLFASTYTEAHIAALHQRGGRSGIGIGTFAQGGLIVDGGRGAQTVVPPIICRHAFPQDWHFLLITDNSRDGLHGQGEKTAFKQLPPQSQAATQALQQRLLSHGLPALIEQDFPVFSQFVGELQAYNAEYFAPAQGGPYASAFVSQILQQLKLQGHRGLGQTSWGPTGFVLLPTRSAAVALQMQLLARYEADTALGFLVTAAVNAPALIEVNACTD